MILTFRNKPWGVLQKNNEENIEFETLKGLHFYSDNWNKLKAITDSGKAIAFYDARSRDRTILNYIIPYNEFKKNHIILKGVE